MITVILGGTSGLGKEIARVLQQKGTQTFVVGRSYDEQVHGPGMKADLADVQDVRRCTEKLAEFNEQVHFYWVAGYGYQGDFAQQSSPEVMAAVNFGNVLPVVQMIWRNGLDAPEANRIIIISSTSGYKARKDEAVYAATKHAQTGFARSLGLEAERLGARNQVALFMPGGMQTPFWGGNKPAQYDAFLDPKKVAAHIVTQVAAQTAPFYEEVIERGSL